MNRNERQLSEAFENHVKYIRSKAVVIEVLEDRDGRWKIECFDKYNLKIGGSSGLKSLEEAKFRANLYFKIQRRLI